jgi:flagellar biosynthetic protein FlhB
MAEEDQDSKTEQATGRHLDKAREHGDVLSSHELKTGAALIGMLVVVWLIAPMMIHSLKPMLANMLEHMGDIRVQSTEDLADLSATILLRLALVMIVPFAVMMGIGVTASIAQTGWMFTLERIMPKFSKINPLAGLKRMFSLNSVVDLLKSIAKLIAVASACYFLLQPKLKELEHLASMELPSVLAYLHSVVIRLMMTVVIMMITIAGADWFYQRFSFQKKMRMSRQEVKDENKDTEGDPMVKARLRGLRIARARQRMMAAVPKADVIITNPTHYACALAYDQEKMNAPMLIAKGRDNIALRIREVAEENEIPIVENPPLARALFASVEIDQEIPPEHYKAVAEVISYVMRLKEKYRPSRR